MVAPGAMLPLLLCTLALAVCLVVPGESSISADDVRGNLHFATKTAYRNRRPLPDDLAAEERFLRARCSPVHVSLLVRHGTRCPSAKQVRKLERLHVRLNASFTGRERLPSLLRGWRSAFDAATDKELSAVGREEMLELGRRFRARYETRTPVVEDSFSFVTSGLARAKESALAFLDGLGMRRQRVLVHEKERLVRYFAYCARYQAAVRRNKTALREYHQFKRGPEMAALVKAVKARFHLEDIDFGPGDLELIFLMCGFEIANNVTTGDDSPWCQMFFASEAPTLEYLQDLKQYWRKSYAYAINYVQACHLIADIIISLHDAVLYWDRPGTFSLYFGHAETIIPVITLLGIPPKEEHIGADNFSTMRDRRNFRTSALSPFGANFALELHRCPGAEKKWDYFVRPLINEAPVRWDLCKRSFCPYQAVAELLGRCAPGRYDHEATCAIPEETVKPVSGTSGTMNSAHDEL